MIDLGVMAHHFIDVMETIVFSVSFSSLSFCSGDSHVARGMLRDPELVLGLIAVWSYYLITWALFENRSGKRLQLPRSAPAGESCKRARVTGAAGPKGPSSLRTGDPGGRERPLSAPSKSLTGVIAPLLDMIPYVKVGRMPKAPEVRSAPPT